MIHFNICVIHNIQNADNTMKITQSALRIGLMTNPFVSNVIVYKEYINYAQVFTNYFLKFINQCTFAKMFTAIDQHLLNE